MERGVDAIGRRFDRPLAAMPVARVAGDSGQNRNTRIQTEVVMVEEGKSWVAAELVNGTVRRKFVCHLSNGYHIAGNWQVGPSRRPVFASRKKGKSQGEGGARPLQKRL